MSSPEHGEGKRPKENEPIPYYQAARFADEKPAGRAYFQAQETLFNNPDCDLSVFRVQLNHISHVVLLGDPPQPDLEQKLLKILSSGEPASLPPDIIKVLQERRARAITKASWVERHYRPGKQV